jgi:hypothetical protein
VNGDSNVEKQEVLAEFRDYDYFANKQVNATYLIKDVTPNVMTKESSSFFEAFRAVVEEYFEKIDNDCGVIDYRRFNYS